MEELAYVGIVDAHIPTHRVDGELAGGLQAIDCRLSPIDQRLDIAGIIGVASRYVQSKNEPDRGF